MMRIRLILSPEVCGDKGKVVHHLLTVGFNKEESVSEYSKYHHAVL